MKKNFTVFVPATSANLGSGYDVLGLALDFGNTVDVIVTEKENDIKITIEGEQNKSITDPNKNMFIQSMYKVFEIADCSCPGLHIKAVNQIPLSRGLGSSAATIVGGMLAANYILENKFNEEDIFRMACDMEGHGDNIAPALYGGLTVAYNDGTSHCHYKASLNADLKVILAIPDFYLSTHEAREVIPDNISRRDAVYNIGRTALLMAALLRNDYFLLREAMQDSLHQPYREKLVPGLGNVFAAALDNGAYSVALSGSGPTVIAFVDKEKDTAVVEKEMKAAFEKESISCRTCVTSISNDGSRLLDA